MNQIRNATTKEQKQASSKRKRLHLALACIAICYYCTRVFQYFTFLLLSTVSLSALVIRVATLQYDTS